MDLIDAIQVATRACGNAGLRRMGCGFGCRLDPIQLLVVRQRRALDERLQWRFAGAILARVRPFGVVRLHPHVNVSMRLFQRLVQRTRNALAYNCFEWSDGIVSQIPFVCGLLAFVRVYSMRSKSRSRVV